MGFFKRSADSSAPETGPIWPTPKFDEGLQPHFLFLITPPYSGSTAIARLLNTSHRTALLQKRGEGQWLVPGLNGKGRWDPDMPVDYASVKAIWLRAFQDLLHLTQTTDVVIEKSPPNMVRIEKLADQFRDCSFIANHRNPYANCSSILYRRHEADSLGRAERIEALKKLTHTWLKRTHILRDLVERLGCPLLTYEAFCDDPSTIKSLLSLPTGVADTIDPNAEIQVKNYPAQRISNQNERQISNLTEEEIAAMSSILEREGDLLAFFNYQTLR